MLQTFFVPLLLSLIHLLRLLSTISHSFMIPIWRCPWCSQASLQVPRPQENQQLVWAWQEKGPHLQQRWELVRSRNSERGFLFEGCFEVGYLVVCHKRTNPMQKFETMRNCRTWICHASCLMPHASWSLVQQIDGPDSHFWPEITFPWRHRWIWEIA